MMGCGHKSNRQFVCLLITVSERMLFVRYYDERVLGYIMDVNLISTRISHLKLFNLHLRHNINIDLHKIEFGNQDLKMLCSEYLIIYLKAVIKKKSVAEIRT